MKKIILMVLFGLSLISSTFGQSYPSVSINEDTLFLSSSVKYYVGQKVKIGVGTSDGDYFKYIKINQAEFTAVMTTTNDRKHNRDMYALDPMYSGKLGEVKKLRVTGSEKRGYHYELLLSLDGTVTYPVLTDEEYQEQKKKKLFSK